MLPPRTGANKGRQCTGTHSARNRRAAYRYTMPLRSRLNPWHLAADHDSGFGICGCLGKSPNG